MGTTILSTWKEPGEVSIRAAWARREADGSLLDSLEAGLTAAELDPSLVAIGLGSLPNQDGELELDAAVMDGESLAAGSVCGVRGIVPVISAARKVMEETPHVMLCGDSARRFAISRGLTPRNLLTEESIRWFEERRSNERPETVYVHSTQEIGHHGDTVTMLAHEAPSHCVAATSTSGLAYKMPGRVGDSPIIGAGIYADDEVGCAGATGWGEELWKLCASFRVVEAMRRGLSAQDACDETIRQLIRRQPRSSEMMCVVIGLAKDGSYGAACNTGTFHLWVCRDGAVHCETREGLLGGI